jgi:hypothetical protein
VKAYTALATNVTTALELHATTAHPTLPFGRHAQHQGMGRHIAVDHGTSANKSELPNGDTTNYGGVGP